MFKKLIFCFALVGSVVSLCAQNNRVTKSEEALVIGATKIDTVSYAIGCSLAEMARSFDTTLNVGVLTRAFADHYAGQSDMTSEQVESAIRYYTEWKRQQAQAQWEQLAIVQAEESAAFILSKESEEGVTKTPSGLLIKIEKPGGSALPQDGDILTVDYTLSLPDGEVVDSSVDRGEPFVFENIDGGLISGFLEGVNLLGEGGKARLYIPSSLGYGADGAEGIKPNQALIFDIELMKIEKR